MSASQEPQIFWHAQTVTRDQREKLHRHRGCVVWFTGLSGSGKSTIANAVESKLFHRGCTTYLLDGDNVRHGLCAGPALLAPEYGQEFSQRFGLGFGPEDQVENIRRVGSLAQLFVAAGIITLTAFVSPYRKDRDRVRQWVVSQGETLDFIEVFVDTPLEICEQRDPKGLYKQARAGKIANFTGISDPYEAPVQPELHLRGGEGSVDQLSDEVVRYLIESKIVSM
ncbi:MAG: adenylyl-sulfate kinase [Pirellulales bacterium]